MTQRTQKIVCWKDKLRFYLPVCQAIQLKWVSKRSTAISHEIIVHQQDSNHVALHCTALQLYIIFSFFLILVLLGCNASQNHKGMGRYNLGGYTRPEVHCWWEFSWLRQIFSQIWQIFVNYLNFWGDVTLPAPYTPMHETTR